MENLVNNINEKEYSLIVAIVNRGYADNVVNASRKAGARGATIMHGQGTMKDGQSVFGINLHSDKDIVLILAKKDIKSAIMDKIVHETSIEELGNGICFSLPVNKIIGLTPLSIEDLNKLNDNSEKENNNNDKNEK